MSFTPTKSPPILSTWKAPKKGVPPLRSRTLLTPSLGSCLGSLGASGRHRTPIVPAPSCTRLAKPVLGKGGGEQARRDSRLPLRGSLTLASPLPAPHNTQELALSSIEAMLAWSFEDLATTPLPPGWPGALDCTSRWTEELPG